MTSGSTIRCGLIGAGIQQSLSPAMHEQEARSQGLRCEYKLIDLDVLGVGVEALSRLIENVRQQNYTGLNITYPCKQAVLPLLDELSDEGRSLGAVNTIVFRDGRMTGHNTDWSGFAASFQRGLPGAAIDRVVQLGAGGSGAAVAHAALTLGTGQLIVFDIDASRAVGLCENLSRRFGEGRALAGKELADAMPSADGLIHCTPTGMAKWPGMPLPASLLEPRHWIAEIVYFPLETELLRVARARGCRTLDGGGMAVFQAAGAFRLFTGRDADAARMEAHFRALVGSQSGGGGGNRTRVRKP